MDISSFISWFVSMFSSIIGRILALLGNIKFMGTSLLGYSITLMILGVVFNILFSKVRNRRVREVSNGDRKGKGESDDS